MGEFLEFELGRTFIHVHVPQLVMLLDRILALLDHHGRVGIEEPIVNGKWGAVFGGAVMKRTSGIHVAVPYGCKVTVPFHRTELGKRFFGETIPSALRVFRRLLCVVERARAVGE